MDKITVAYMMGETKQAMDTAAVIMAQSACGQRPLVEGLAAAAAIDLLMPEAEGLLERWADLWPGRYEGSVVSRQDVFDDARRYATDNPDLLAQVETRLREQEDGGVT